MAVDISVAVIRRRPLSTWAAADHFGTAALPAPSVAASANTISAGPLAARDGMRAAAGLGDMDKLALRQKANSQAMVISPWPEVQPHKF